LSGEIDISLISIVFLPAYRLAEPHVIDMRRDYGGCRSWIDLADPVSTIGSTPSISDESFDKRRALTMALLGATF
jgi:hypothetical protein